MRSSLLVIMLTWGMGASVAQTVAPVNPAPGAITPTNPIGSHAPLTAAQRRLSKITAPARSGAKGRTVEVPPDTPVVTLQGICPAPQHAKDCKTVITREELDEFASGFSPKVTDSVRGRLAVQYAGTLAFATLAERRGFEKSPVIAKEIAEQLKFLKMRILAGAFLQGLDVQAPPIREEAVKKYYDEHQGEFERAQVRRIALPFVAPTDSGKRLELPALRSEMESLRSKAVDGGDLTQLLQDAFKNLHIAATPPATTVTTLRKSDVQGEEAKAFLLGTGEISQVIDSTAAFVIYKMESKQTLPLAAAHKEIEATLHQQEIRDQIQRLTTQVSAEFNLPYLHMTTQPDIFALPVVQGRGALKNSATDEAEVKAPTVP